MIVPNTLPLNQRKLASPDARCFEMRKGAVGNVGVGIADAVLVWSLAGRLRR